MAGRDRAYTDGEDERIAAAMRNALLRTELTPLQPGARYLCGSGFPNQYSLSYELLGLSAWAGWTAFRSKYRHTRWSAAAVVLLTFYVQLPAHANSPRGASVQPRAAAQR